MSQKIASYLFSALSDRSRVTGEILVTALFYVEASRGRFPASDEGDLLPLLREETFSPDTLQDLKGALVSLAADPGLPLELFVSSVRVLQEFGDPKLVPLM